LSRSHLIDFDNRRTVLVFRYALVLLLFLQMAGCAVVTGTVSGKSNLEEFWILPLFCTVANGGLVMRWFALFHSLVLVIVPPLLIAVIFSEKFRLLATVLGVVSVIGTLLQAHFLNVGLLGCDSP
jgi:hypothetical protein